MGKVNPKARKHTNHHDNPHSTKNKISRRQYSQHAGSKAGSGNKRAVKKASAVAQQQNQKVKIPFSKRDNVLLIGEGDFSFALSLKESHRSGSLTATCFDSKESLEEKYPSVATTLAKLEGRITDRNASESEWEGFSPPPGHGDEEDESSDILSSSRPASLLFGIDATKLSTVHKKVLRKSGPFTKIVFNFPHVGGLSTDVNRQVRANQQLLVGFFNAAKPFLSINERGARDYAENFEDVDSAIEEDEETLNKYKYSVKGQILVTLFEGEPYTLWNIRDLARHCGLKVVESFKFPWHAYPGYKHARTIGDITIGKDRSEEGKRKGAWRGEERDARCFILEVKDDENKTSNVQSRKKPDKAQTHNSNDDSD